MAIRLLIVTLLVLQGCETEAVPAFSEYEPADVYFPKQKKNLHVLPDDEEEDALRFRYCGDEVAFDKCPVLSDCTFKVADLRAAAAKEKNAALKDEFEELLTVTFQSKQTPEVFLEPFCKLLAGVRKEEKCKQKNACADYLKKK